DAETLEQVDQRCGAVGIDDQTLDTTDTLELMGQFQLFAGLLDAGVDHILNTLQLGARAIGANALDLIGGDGELLRQVHGVERDQLALAGDDHMPRRAARSGWYERQDVAVLLDLLGNAEAAL